MYPYCKGVSSWILKSALQTRCIIFCVQWAVLALAAIPRALLSHLKKVKFCLSIGLFTVKEQAPDSTQNLHHTMLHILSSILKLVVFLPMWCQPGQAFIASPSGAALPTSARNLVPFPF